MNILQVNPLDLTGRQFNGYDLNEALRRQGHQAVQCVSEKESGNQYVKRIIDTSWNLMTIIEIEQQYKLYWQLNPYGLVLMERPEFQTADLVHYHLIHNNLLAIPDFPALTQAKPSVWTWHDPWAATGHCVHPFECQGWRSRCTPCPHPENYFPMRSDCAHTIWELKRQAYQKMDVDIVVASDFMLNFARNSPLGQLFLRVHKIPFGIHKENYGKKNLEEARTRFGISNDRFVIAFRCETSPFKGTEYIYKMLDRIDCKENITLLCVGIAAPPKSVTQKFHTVSLGWQNDPQLLADFYSACNVFLMPSTAEAFGLMAVEAMASARPMICFEGTALPSVTFAPQCGIAVPPRDVDALLSAVRRLRDCPEEAHRRGRMGQEIVQEHYLFQDYVRRHLELYAEVLERRRAKTIECRNK